MGMIDRFIGVGTTVSAVSDAATGGGGIFGPNANRRMELDEEAYARAIAQYQAEFGAGGAQAHWFDCLVNGLNRLPRPLLTLGTIGLFIYAMTDPAGFSARMQGLALVPEPLWWLMGAIVSFYFGAREAHYLRNLGWARNITRANPGGGAPVYDDGWRAPAPPLPELSREENVLPVTDDPRGQELEVADQDRSVAALTQAPADDFADNAALRDWRLARVVTSR